MKKNVVIIDDHEIVRMGLKRLLSEHKRYNVLFAIESPKHIPRDLSDVVDIVILDLSFSVGLCDLSCIDYVKTKFPNTNIIVFSMMDEEIFGLDVIKYGVKGFVSKDTSGEYLIEALNKVCDGGVYLSNKL